MTPLSSSSEIIARSAELWNHYEGLEAFTLLRLAVLRNLSRLLHAERSRCLARGMKHEIAPIRHWEKRIEELRNADALSGTLDEVLSGKVKTGNRIRLLPESLFNAIPKNKFDRFDRTWESALAAEAAHLGWRFWRLDGWLEIQMAEKTQQLLEDRLLPHGIVLFTEGSEMQGELWHGQWTLVLQPKAEPAHFDVGGLAGISSKPTPPQWKLLYSPSKPA